VAGTVLNRPPDRRPHDSSNRNHRRCGWCRRRRRGFDVHPVASPQAFLPAVPRSDPEAGARSQA